jgi:hypothetical protein
MTKVSELRAETVIRFTRATGRVITLKLTERPTNARRLNGVSDSDEWLVVGYVVKQGTLYLDGRYRRKKPFMVKETGFEIVRQVTESEEV